MTTDSQIKRWQTVRRLFLRRTERARERRDEALAANKKLKAKGALRVVRRNRGEAQAVLKKIRHRRRVLSLRKSRRGLAWFDGKKVSAWIAVELQKARDAGRWKGYVVSGWRDPVYSEKLCYAMCGKPACPGLCAGRASNHSGIEYPGGAVDVTDYQTLYDECTRLDLRIKNRLPIDRVHFSAGGR